MRLRIVRRLSCWFHALLLWGGGRHVYSAACRAAGGLLGAIVRWRSARYSLATTSPGGAAMAWRPTMQPGQPSNAGLRGRVRQRACARGISGMHLTAGPLPAHLWLRSGQRGCTQGRGAAGDGSCRRGLAAEPGRYMHWARQSTAGAAAATGGALLGGVGQREQMERWWAARRSVCDGRASWDGPRLRRAGWGRSHADAGGEAWPGAKLRLCARTTGAERAGAGSSAAMGSCAFVAGR